MTAVEWFFRWFNDNPEATHKEYAEAFQQAIGMEKQQIIESYERGWDIGALDINCNSEKYYSETYKPNNL